MEIDWHRLAVRRTHPLAIRILELYAELAEHDQGASPLDLVPVLRARSSSAAGVSLGNVSYHVKKLHSDGVLEELYLARVRGALKHYYRLAPEMLAADE